MSLLRTHNMNYSRLASFILLTTNSSQLGKFHFIDHKQYTLDTDCMFLFTRGGDDEVGCTVHCVKWTWLAESNIEGSTVKRL